MLQRKVGSMAPLLCIISRARLRVVLNTLLKHNAILSVLCNWPEFFLTRYSADVNVIVISWKPAQVSGARWHYCVDGTIAQTQKYDDDGLLPT